VHCLVKNPRAAAPLAADDAHSDTHARHNLFNYLFFDRSERLTTTTRVNRERYVEKPLKTDFKRMKRVRVFPTVPSSVVDLVRRNTFQKYIRTSVRVFSNNDDSKKRLNTYSYRNILDQTMRRPGNRFQHQNAIHGSTR